MKYKESENLELKSSFGEWKEIIITLTAFANKKGGKIIIGLDDKGIPVELQTGKSTIEDLVNKIKNNVDPVLYPSINVKTFGLGEIVEIEIPENDNKPVFAFGRAYIRVGRTNQKMSNAEVRTVIKHYVLPDFDTRSIEKSIKEIKLDNGLIQKLNREYYCFGKISELNFLKKLELIKKNKITNAGYLCFANKNDLLHNAVIKAARFKGKTMVKFLDMKSFDLSVILAVDKVLDFIKRHINMEVEIVGKARRKEIWDYPLDALREAVINAAVHRDYSDSGNIQIRIFDNRLEIWSPGLLPKEIDITKLLIENRSIPRNKIIAKIFNDIGLIEGWGTGFQRMVKECEKNGNRPPEFNDKAGAFVTTFYKKENGGINGGINKLLKFIKNNSGKRTAEIALGIGAPAKTAEKWIKKLKDKNIIEFKGSKKGGGYYLK